MKHLGKFLKESLENKHLVKKDIAQKAGISYGYLTVIFNRSSMDCQLWENLCNAANLDAGCVFDLKNHPQEEEKSQSLTETISSLKAQLADKERIIVEKERIITLLQEMRPHGTGTATEQHL
jgi:hypothetical protein